MGRVTGFTILASLLLLACNDDNPTADPPLVVEIDAEVLSPDAGEGGMGGEGGTGEGGQGGMGGVGGMGGMGGQGGTGGMGGSPAPGCVETTVDTIDLGSVTINGGSEPITIDLPEDVISLTLLAIEGTDSAFVGVGLLEGPDGTILVAENPPGGILPNAQFAALFPGPFSSPNRFATSATGVGGLLAPNNPSVAVTPGTWTIELLAADQNGRPANTTVQLTAHVKRAAQDPTCGVLDLHFYFTGAQGWTADNAPDDQDFQGAVARMRAFYSEIGIELGVITYDDVEGGAELRTVDATGGPASGLHDLYSRCAYESGVCLFFVERLTSPFGGGGGGGIGGVAGGAPGPTLMPGTYRSGVAVATSSASSPGEIGHIMGHETGHYLGLYHTQEFIGFTDQIDDTPAGQGGNTNLMYPTVTAGEAALSAGQGWVLLRNASIYETEEASK
jgi:hypothetical protein